MRLLVISPLILLTASYFSCYVNTWSGTSYLEVHVYNTSGNVSGAKTEVWSTASGYEALVATQMTDADGQATFELPAGTSEVRVHFGSTDTSQTVSLGAGETKRVEFFECTNCDP